MAIKMQNRIDPTFSATSMSDLVFLLLIFFMLSPTPSTSSCRRALRKNSFRADNWRSILTRISTIM